MTLYRAFDASLPPEFAPPGMTAVMGYAGGNTPHVWTKDEWDRFSHLYQAPIWVGYQENDPREHANQAVAAVQALGFSANPPSRNRRWILVDFETEIDPAWIDSFASVIWSAGYQTGVYGSQSTVDANPVKEGRWVALYNGVAGLTSDAGAVAHQYLANEPFGNTFVDYSVVSAEFLAHCGVGPRS